MQLRALGRSSLRVAPCVSASRAKRPDVVISTKVGMEMAPDRKGLSAAHIARSVEESLRRLQTDYRHRRLDLHGGAPGPSPRGKSQERPAAV